MAKDFFGHPSGLSTLFFTEMWERFSYYGMRAILILFMTAKVDGRRYGTEYGRCRCDLWSDYSNGLHGGATGRLDCRSVSRPPEGCVFGGVLIADWKLLSCHPLNSVRSTPDWRLLSPGLDCLKPNVSAIVGLLYPLT